MDLENIGAPERSRTPDPQIRSLVLYPAELPALALEEFGRREKDRRSCPRTGRNL